MSVSSWSTHQGRRSWRESRSGGNTSRGKKLFARWTISAIALLLCIGLVLLFYWGWRSPPTTHFVDFQIEYDRGMAAPRLTSANELAALVDSLRERAFRLKVADSSVWKTPGESGSTSQLATNFQQLAIENDDTLVFFVSANGVSIDGEPCLLTSDFNVGGVDGPTGYFPFSELLKALSATKARHKLLLLDWGRIQFDPRLGIAYNEFPELAAEAVRELNDPSLWVILSHTDAAPPTIYIEQRSLFAASLSEALAGDADRPPADRDITLQELFRYIYARYDTWFGPGGAVSHPALLRGGEGWVKSLDAANWAIVHVRDIPPVELGPDGKPVEDTQDAVARSRIGHAARSYLGARINAQTPVSEARTLASRTRRATEKAKFYSGADVAQNDEATEDSEEASDGSKAKDSAAKSGAGEAANDSSPEEAPSADGPTLASTLSVAAIDLAELNPELTATLDKLYKAWRIRDRLQARVEPTGWSPVDFAPHSWRQLNADLLVLEQQLLSSSDPSELNADLDSIVSDLQRIEAALRGELRGMDRREIVAQWNRFRGSSAYASFAPEDDELAKAALALRGAHAALFEAPWMIQWLASAAASTNSLPHYSSVRALIEQASQLKRRYDELAGTPLVPESASMLRESWSELISRRAEVGQLITDEIQQALPEAPDPRKRTRYERDMAVLLSTPLLTAEQRLPLLVSLMVPRGEYPEIDESWPDVSPKPPQFAARLDIARRLAALAITLDASFGNTEIASLEMTEPIDLRKVGSALRTHDVALGKEERYEARLLADPREVPRGEVAAHFNLLPPVKTPTLQAEVTSVEPLVMNEWAKVALRVHAGGEPLGPIAGTIRFDPEQIEVGESAGSGIRSITPNERLPIGDAQSASSSTELIWEVFVRPHAQATANAREAQLSIHFISSGMAAIPADIPLPLPVPPSRIRLEVRREGAGPEDQLAEGISLRPFPNRTTGFQFYLVNPSLHARKVQVDLYAAPAPPTDVRRAPGRFFQEQVLDGQIRRSMMLDERRLRPDIVRSRHLVSTPAPVTVAANSGAVPIELRRQAPPAPMPAEGQPEPPAPELPPLDADVSHGMIAVVTALPEGELEEEIWIEWLEIIPLEPRRYLEVRPSYQNDRIEVRLKAQLVPIDLGPEKPITVQLDRSSGPAAAATRETDKITGRDQEGLVWVATPPDGQKRRIRLHVDGVPRAFEYEIVCEPQGTVENVRRDKLFVQMTTLTPETIATSPPPDPENAPPPPPPQAISRDPLLPNALRTCDRLWLDLEVDAPETQFDFIEVGLSEERFLTFYSDRMEQVRLVGEGDSLLLATTVSDLRVPLDVEGRQGPLTIEARVFDSGERPPDTAREQYDRANIILDGTRPILEEPVLSQTAIPKNAKLRITVSADDGRDGSGIAEIAAGIDVDNTRSLDNADPVMSIHDRRGTIELDLKDLKEDRRYRLLVVATDRVGLKSNVYEREITVLPPEMAPAPTKPDKGDIVGKVSFRGVAAVSANQVQVRLEGSNLPPQSTGPGGTFRFRDVPAGKYTLIASGAFSGMRCEGKLENVVVPSDKPVTIVVDRP